MNSIEKIQERILDEAKEKAKENVDAAIKESKSILDSSREVADKRLKDIREKAAIDASNRKQRILAATELDGKKMKLKAKQDMVSSVFTKAVEKIKKKPLEEYREIILGMIVSSSDNEEAEIIFSEEDKKRLGKDFEKTINSALKNAGKAAATVASDTANISGGFILRKGSIEINNSFEAIISMKKDKLSEEIVKILF
jgi:V/A-type H+-transporting ATPase subunit E